MPSAADARFMRISPIRTKRLVLRRPRRDDAGAAIPLLNDRAIARFIPLIPSPYRRRDWLSFIRKNSGKPEKRPEGLSYPFVIEMDGRMIGMIGMRWDAKDSAANIGYWVGRPYRRKGIATEAAQGLTDHAFGKLRAEKVWATVLKGNAGSPKVLKACGMRYEGTLRSHQVHRGRRVDVEHYSVLRSEWKRRRRR
jgi:RimJ/RimL family protein N-acetyltransferase